MRKRNRFVRALVLMVAGVMALGLLAPALVKAAAGAPEADQVHVAVTQDPTGANLIVFMILAVTNRGSEPLSRLEIPLPDGYENLTPIQGVVSPERSNRALTDLDGLAAGGTKRIMLTYSMKADGGRIGLDLTMPYPVREMVLSVAKGGMEVQAQGLNPAGERQMDGITWLRFARENLPAGTPLHVSGNITGPAPTPTGAAPAGTGTTVRTGQRVIDEHDIIGHKHGADTWKAVSHLLLILAAFALVMKGSLFPARHARPQDRSLALDSNARVLINQLAALDLDFQQGRVNARTYRVWRDLMKRDLLAAVGRPHAARGAGS